MTNQSILKFKEGDRVRVIDNCRCICEVGQIGEIIDVDYDCDSMRYPYKVRFDYSLEGYDWMNEDQIELVGDVEEDNTSRLVELAKNEYLELYEINELTDFFVEGDYCRVVDTDYRYPCHEEQAKFMKLPNYVTEKKEAVNGGCYPVVSYMPVLVQNRIAVAIQVDDHQEIIGLTGVEKITEEEYLEYQESLKAKEEVFEEVFGEELPDFSNWMRDTHSEVRYICDLGNNQIQLLKQPKGRVIQEVKINI